MQKQPWRSQRVEQGKGRHENGQSAGTSASIYATTPFRPASAATAVRLASSSADLPIDLISSPSRGLDKSDSSRDLTNADTQAKYRDHISEKIRRLLIKKGKSKELFPFTLPKTSSSSSSISSNNSNSTAKYTAEGVDGPLLEGLQDILLLVRRLREGCVASSRHDAFAIDVYALSTYLSMLIADDIQLSSSLPRLFDLLVENGESKEEEEDQYLAMEDLASLLDIPAESVRLDLKLPNVAALYLLWLSVTGGQVARIGGGVQKSSKPSSSLYLQQRQRVFATLNAEQQQSDPIKATEEFHAALARQDTIAFRSAVLKRRHSAWQQALIRRNVDSFRESVWDTLKKSYLHVPIDGRLMGEGEKGGGDDWLERMLLIDVELLPPPPPPPLESKTPSKSSSQVENVPDTWDDSVDQLADALKSTKLLQVDPHITHVRATRLAAVFDAFHLPIDESVSLQADTPLAKWSSRKVTQAGQPHLKIR